MLKNKLSLSPNFKTFLNEAATVAQHLKRLEAPFLEELKTVVRQELQKIPYFQTNGLRNLNLYANFFVKILLENNMGNPNLNQILDFAKNQQGSKLLVNATSFINGYWRKWGDYIISIHSNNNAVSKFNNSVYTAANLDADVKVWHEQLALKRSGAGAEGRTVVDLASIGWKGWKWVSLDKGYCSVEAKAAGHCGNAAGRPGDNILSLRDPGGYPHLTFIVNDKTLGEAKGRGNDKPVPKYHPAIMAILLSNEIASIRGGGYKPENNFQIKDLSEEDRQKLLTAKPDIDYIDSVFKNIDLAKLSDLFNVKFIDMKVVNGGDVVFVEKLEDWSDLYKTIKDGHWDKKVKDFSWLEDSYQMFDNIEVSDSEIKDSFDYLSPELIKAIEDHYNEKYGEDWQEEGDIQDAIIAMDDEVKSAFDRACEFAIRSGTESKAYKDVIEQLGSVTDHGFWFDIDTWTICITPRSLKDLYADHAAVFDNDGESLSYFYDFEYEPPYYGYDHEFDEESFKEYIKEFLSEAGVNVNSRSILTK